MNPLWVFILAFLLLLPFPIIPCMIHGVFGRFFHQKNVMMFASVYAAALALIIWRVDLVQIGAAFVRAYWLSYELVALTTCAFLLQQPFRQSRACSVIREGFARINPDPRIQAIFVAWFFGSGVESIMGIATTNGLCVLILSGLGFSPMCASMLALMGTATASAFCSVGTPILYGLRHGLEEPYFLEQLTAMGLDVPSYLRLVTAQIGLIHGIVGTFQPLIMVLMITRFFGTCSSWKEDLQIVPFAIFSGLAFCVPFTLSAIFFGPEFASMVGALVGTALAIIALKAGFFEPEKIWRLPTQDEWRHDWSFSKIKFKPEALAPMSPWAAWSPLLILASLLIITRMSRNFLASFTFTWPNIFGSPVTVSSEAFYLPVTWIYILVTVIATWIYKLNGVQIRSYAAPTLVPSSSTLLKAPNVIFMISIFMITAINHAGLPSMTRLMAEAMAQLPWSSFWCAFFTPLMGALTSALCTNNVFSNLFCAPIVFNMEQALNAPPGFLMALQAAGSSVGTMIALRYITSTLTCVDLRGWEGPVGRRMIMPVLIYTLLLGIVGILGLTVFNFSTFAWYCLHEQTHTALFDLDPLIELNE